MRILDTGGTVLRDRRPRPGDRASPEIDRGQLRDLLLGPLDVQWGRVVTEVVPESREGVLVRFADGRRETFDLVIGADGAWSRVRPAVSSVTPRYTGVTLVETSLDDVDTRHPDLARLVGDGSVAVYGVNRALVAQRDSGGHVKVYAQFRVPLDWHPKPDRHRGLDQSAGLGPADVEAVRSSLFGHPGLLEASFEHHEVAGVGHGHRTPPGCRNWVAASRVVTTTRMRAGRGSPCAPAQARAMRARTDEVRFSTTGADSPENAVPLRNLMSTTRL